MSRISKKRYTYDMDGRLIVMYSDSRDNKIYNDAVELIKKQDSIIESQRETLEKIASWNEGPKVNSSFNEPRSAEIARRELVKEGKG